MKSLSFYLLIFFALSFDVFVDAKELLNVDFTRDSVMWKTKFSKPEWNSSHTDYSAFIQNRQIDAYLLNGNWGIFNKNTPVFAQPICSEDNTRNHRWAFRLENTGNSYIEFPKLPNTGRLTLFCKNESPDLEASFCIQKKTEETWSSIKTITLPPHYEQNYEIQVEEFLNIQSDVKLRISGATRNIHIYSFRVNSYEKPETTEKPLRMILLPDPQTYTKFDYLNKVYAAQTLWINKNADSIAFVLCQGDMTGGNRDDQWRVAASAFSLLEGRKIPFTFAVGNHDLGKLADSRDASLVNKYLPYSRYSGNSYFGGAFEPGKMENTWHTFSSGNYKFLILSLEFFPRNKVLEWAKKVIESHPKFNVIINTHAYLTANNERVDVVIKQKIGSYTGDDFANNGVNMWEKLVSIYPNCLFVFNGHVTGKGIGHLVSKGVNGNKVYQFLANYQIGVDGSQEDRNGMLRIVDLNPENKSFTIKTYSPYTNKYNTAEGQEFHYQNVDFIKDVNP